VSRFVITLVAAPGVNAVRSLRRLLKYASRHCDLRVDDAHQVYEAYDPDLPAQLAGASPHNNDPTIENAREAARRCLGAGSWWTTRERNFLSEATRLETFSERQLEWLRILYARAKRTNAAEALVQLHHNINSRLRERS
jgi:3-keto-L-gulonate-6-phosphate decarboxylase